MAYGRREVSISAGRQGQMTGRWGHLLLAAASLSVPGLCSAQSPATIPRIGLLSWSSCANLPAPLMSGLVDLGYIPGKTLIMECRSAEQSYDRLLPAAEELVSAPVDLIIALSHPTARAARLVTKSVPIVMIASGDPAASGLVNSLARPGGNVTGLSYYATELTGKRLEFLRDMVPSISVIGVLANPAVAYLPFEGDTRRAAATLGLRVAIHQVCKAADLNPTSPIRAL
jgi:putative tryptophan/tyrosine transport system substrate-binding protein